MRRCECCVNWFELGINSRYGSCIQVGSSSVEDEEGHKRFVLTKRLWKCNFYKPVKIDAPATETKGGE